MELVLRSTSHKTTVELAIKSDEGGVWFAVLTVDENEQIDFNLEKEDWDTFKQFIEDGLNKTNKKPHLE